MDREMSSSAPSRPSLARAVRKWWHDGIAQHGFWPTLQKFIRELWGFLLESTPERRRRRSGDVEYDWDYRVDTTSATVSFRNRLLGIFHSPYQATEAALFHEMVGGLQIDYRKFTFLDLGSGKGRTLLMASDYPFHRIVGVEVLPELHRVAEENIRKYRSERQKCFRIEAICGDARQFIFPKEPTVIYLFNPFPESLFKEVVVNLEHAMREDRQPVYVLYHNPLLEPVLARSSLIRKVGGTHQYLVYTNAG
jgi:SAM-dependent methyltransferase